MENPAIVDLSDIAKLGGGGGGGGMGPTQDMVYWQNTGASLQNFIAPFAMRIRSMTIPGAIGATRAIVSLNGRTTFDTNAISGVGGGLIGCPGTGKYWIGNFEVKAGAQVWINVPIGNEIHFTIERLAES